MPLHPVYYIPIFTTIISLIFASLVFRRYHEKGKGAHLLWWAAGIVLYGVGTFTESYVTLFGWREEIFRAWYISGALLGGAPLAQGTVYLLLRRETANRLTIILIPVLLTAAAFAMVTPLDYTLVEAHRLSGKVIEWQWVRLFSPFINSYAFVFLVGGAALSAYRFKKSVTTYHRFIGNVFIATGALLPGVGGTIARLGHTEVLYVMELIGLVLIFVGYEFCIGTRAVNGVAVRPAKAGAQAST